MAAGIRPERLVVHATAPAAQANVLRAQVRSIVYFGDHLRLMCHVADGQEPAVAKLALATATIPQPGDDVWLEFPSDLTRVYT